MPHIHLHDYGAGKNSANHGKGSGDTCDYEPGKNPASHAAVTVHKASEKFHRELSNVANGEGDYTSGYKHHKAAEAHNTAAVYHARSHPQANAMSSRANKASKAAAPPAEQRVAAVHGDTRDYEPGKNPASHAAATVHKASEKFHRELANVSNEGGDYTSGYKHHQAAEAHGTAAVYHARSHPQANAMSSRANKASKAAASPAEQRVAARHSAAPGGEAGNAVRPPSRSASAGGTRTQRLFGRR
jgi:hypothetical protein